MKISRLKIRNLFGVKEYDSNGKCIELQGKNGVGKSGILDAIKYALTNKSDREYLILNGESEGEVLIETDTGLRINRKARINKADYKSIKQEGERVEKTEGFLREIFTELQLNPVEFASMDSKEQNRIILDLIDFKWDTNWIKEQFGEIPAGVNYEQNILCVLHDIQSEDGEYFLRRQDINREIRNKLAFIEEIGKTLPPNYDAAKWDAVNLGEIYTKIETIRNDNDVVKEAKTFIAGKDAKMREFKNALEIKRKDLVAEENQKLGQLQQDIAELQKQIELKQAAILDVQRNYTQEHKLAEGQYEANVAGLQGEAKNHSVNALKTIIDFSELQAEAKMVEDMKAHVNEYNRMIGLRADIDRLNQETEDLTIKIERARTLPGEILEKSNIPIAGLTIKDGIPLINGLPISNLSEGEKLELCISVAIQNEGALQMLLIDGIERLATEKRETVYSRLKEKGVQFIATRTTDDPELMVVEL